MDQPLDTSHFLLTLVRSAPHMRGSLWLRAAPGPPPVAPFQPMRANLLLSLALLWLGVPYGLLSGCSQPAACKSLLRAHLAALTPSSLLSQKHVCPSIGPWISCSQVCLGVCPTKGAQDAPEKKTTQIALKTCWEDRSCPKLSEKAVGCKTKVKPGLNIVYHPPLPNTPKSPVFPIPACRSRAPGSPCKVTVPAFLPPLPLPWPGRTKAEGKYY